MAPSSKRRQTEITEMLRLSPSPDARGAVELVGLLLEDARSALVQAAADDMLRVQGEARVLDRLYKRLTTAPPNKEI
jgi:hypothetical protein